MKSPQQFRRLLLQRMQRVAPREGRRLALALSGGMDSTVVLLAALELGYPVTCYSFTLSNFLSDDYRLAAQTARALGVPFAKITLPAAASEGLRGLWEVIHHHGAEGTVRAECSWPFLYLVRALPPEERVLLTGFFADAFFGMSKSDRTVYRVCDSVEDFDRLRSYYYYEDWDHAQLQTMARLCKAHRVLHFSPFYCREIFNHFMGTNWKQLNRPTQKQWLRDAFPEVAKLPHLAGTRKQALQMESGISEQLRKWAKKSAWNENGNLNNARLLYAVIARMQTFQLRPLPRLRPDPFVTRVGREVSKAIPQLGQSSNDNFKRMVKRTVTKALGFTYGNWNEKRPI